MAKIVQLKIKNFRGIKDTELNFPPDVSLVCLIGRGDSCKTSVLEAISTVLSSSWNLPFNDTDFHNCNHDEPIEIEASIIGIPEKLLSDSKFGLHIRAYDTVTKCIHDDIVNNSDNAQWQPLITIRFQVDSSLEPTWAVVNQRTQDDKPISATDRNTLCCYMVSDYVDRHFSWNKGNPLYALLKASDFDSDEVDNLTVLNALRSAKNEIDKSHFDEFSDVTGRVAKQAAAFGLDLTSLKTTLDVRELSVKEGRVSLHEENIPFRLKGKGSKRLASFAIQSSLVSQGGIMLVDEIEQGLEPDRVKQVVRALKNQVYTGQIFLTTHSREVIAELAAEDLVLLVRNTKTSNLAIKSLDLNGGNLQGAVRACPEAFFAKKIIVCEGATEVGLCRALDKWRNETDKEPMAFNDCAYIDGTGTTFASRVYEIFRCGIQTSILCDSDCDNINAQKAGWTNEDIGVFDCEEPNSIEQQVFNDLPCEAIIVLINFAVTIHYSGKAQSLEQAVTCRISGTLAEGWQQNITKELRTALGEIAKKGTWFKTIQNGEFLGSVIFKYWDEIDEDAIIKKTLNRLSNWIDK